MLTKLIIGTYTDNYHKFLGFNTYHINKKFVKKDNPIRIKKIKSQNCNKNILEKILLKYVKLNPHIFYYIQNNHIYVKYINDLLKKLKSSGYISYIKILKIHTENNKYITLNIKINPVVKKITVLNYKTLKIPSYFLKNLLQKHIGMPKNYRLMHNSFNIIYLWYKSRGFAWINIELIEQNILNTNHIVFNIIEGVVKDVKLICQTKNIYNSESLKILHSLIKQELGLYAGSILNVNKIERGIKHLTNLNLIQNCNYIIKRDKVKFIVFIKYDISQNNTVYAYNYNSILYNYCNYKQIYNLLSKYLTHLNFFSQYTTYIQKSQIYSSIMQIDQSLNYKFKSFYLKNTISNFFVNLTIPTNRPQLNIIFSHPYIQKQNKTFSHLRIDLYNKTIKTHLCYPFIILRLKGLSINQKSNLLTYLYSYMFSIKNNLLNSISILEKSWLIYRKLIYINLYIKDYQLNKYIEKKSFKDSSLTNIKKLLKYIKYQLISLEISIKHNDFYNYNQPKACQFIKIYSKLLAYIKKNHDNDWHKFVYLGQSIRIQYMQVFELPKIYTYICHHVFLIFSECHFLINSKIHEPIIYRSYNQINNIFFKENQQKRSPLYFFYIFNIEYHISKFKHLSIYCFWNYITYVDNQKQQKPYIKTINDTYKYNIQMGSGIKFYIPIKKLPNIKLEYSIDNKGEYFLRLRTDSKYNE